MIQYAIATRSPAHRCTNLFLEDTNQYISVGNVRAAELWDILTIDILISKLWNILHGTYSFSKFDILD